MNAARPGTDEVRPAEAIARIAQAHAREPKTWDSRNKPRTTSIGANAGGQAHLSLVSPANLTAPLDIGFTHLFLERHLPHHLPRLPRRISPLPSTRDIRYNLSAPLSPFPTTDQKKKEPR